MKVVKRCYAGVLDVSVDAAEKLRDMVTLTLLSLLVGGEHRLHLAPLAKGFMSVTQIKVLEDIIVSGSPVH